MPAEPVAIIGMAGRFPGAEDLDEFWANLVAGRDCLTELSDEELLRHGEDPARLAHPEYVRRRPTIAHSDTIDTELFDITPREAELRDPQYRVLLETVHSTLEHAGYDPAGYTGAIGLFAATNINRYRYDHVENDPTVVESVGYGAIDVHSNPDYMSTYVSYKLGLRGPSATVLTACSSSLVSVHMACTAIRAGDCDMALAGGVDIEFPYHRGYVPLDGWISARDGVVRPFDADCTGTNFGDGAGTVLLKPLAAALRDKDTVYATIIGSAINNDGTRKVGYTAPSVAGQSECITRALRAAGVEPQDISYVEAHGTGTPVGDPIELAGLAEAYRTASRTPLPPASCAIGSVKSNLGHLGQAAGIAALIKTVLSLRHATLPPSINLTTPTPEVDWDTLPFYVNTETSAWPAASGRPRRAGVSSFGIGGTNAHVVLEEAPEPPPRDAAPDPRQTLLWSATNGTVEAQLRERLADRFAGLDRDAFADVAHTLRVGRTWRPVRAALAAGGAADAAAGLRDPKRVRTWDGTTRSVVFAFPGQGAQAPGMCRYLYDTEQMFRQGCDAGFDVLAPLLDRDPRAAWLSATDVSELTAPEVAQPVLYVLEYTLAHCLMQWGVTPRTLVGHSLGELVAAGVAGVFGFEDGLRAVAARALSLRGAPPGAMLAVAARREAVAGVLTDRVALAAVNGPREMVLAGPEEAIAEAAEKLSAQGVSSRRLATSHAFHSPYLAPAATAFEQALDGLTLHPPAVPLLSAATGEPITDEQATSAAYWARRLVEPIDFDAVARTLVAAGPATVVEVGPGNTLGGLLRGRPDVRSAGSKVLPGVGRRPEDRALEETLAALWVEGVPVTYWRQDTERGYRRVAAPGYPYQRQRHWVDLASDPPAETQSTSDGPAVPVASAEAAAPAARWRVAEVSWVRDIDRAPAAGTVAGPAVLLLPSDGVTARSVRAAVQRAGYPFVRAVTADSLDAADPAAWMSIMDESAGPLLVAHAGLLEAPLAVDTSTLDAQLAAGLETVHAALVAAARVSRRRPVAVAVLGRGLVDVTGGEAVNPASAAVLGLLRSATPELPGVRCRAIDIAGPIAPRALAGVLTDTGHPLVALRGTSRWLPRLSPADPAQVPGQLRPGGIYLVTGGLGGVGRAVARSLAETGLLPNIALVGRTPLADLPDRAAAEADLTEIQQAGARVEVFAGNVADVAALDRVVDAVQQRFGPVNGVLHAAGIAGGGLLETRRAKQMREVLRPKAAGLLALEEVFAGRAPLDFLILFSSQAALAGLYGSADYAAANAFLDAHSASRVAGERRTVSVQWPGWTEVGMLARSASARTALAAQHAAQHGHDTADPDLALSVQRAVGRDWEFDEHAFEAVPVLPGTTLLELCVRGARAVRGGGPVEIHDLAFLAPVVGDGSHEVQVRVSPAGREHRVSVRSRKSGSDDPWTEHATGILRTATAEKGADLAALRARLTVLTASPQAGWIDFGPRWTESIVEVRGGADERLARLVLPERFRADLADHPVHPALVDVASGILHDLVPGRPHAPFLYRRALVQGDLPADIHVHIRYAPPRGDGRRPVDFDLYDTETGVLLARLESFSMREVTGGQGLRAPARGPAAQPAPGMLLPAEGGAVLLDLLGRDCPPVVLVDMMDAHLSAPGIPWTDRPAPPEPAPALPAAVPATEAVSEPATGDGTAEALRLLWISALGVEQIGLDDDFFDLGGSSLTAVQLTARINARFGTDLGAGALFDSSTIRRLAADLDDLAP